MMSVKRSKLKTSWLPDVALTTLESLKESADAVPQLKSVVGAILVLVQTIQRVKGSKEKARSLGLHCLEVLNVLADAVSLDPMNISQQLLVAIGEFEKVVNDINAELQSIVNQNPFSRFLHLHKIEDKFLDFLERLNRARHVFMIGGSVRTEIIATRIEKSNGQIESKVDQGLAEGRKAFKQLAISMMVGYFA